MGVHSFSFFCQTERQDSSPINQKVINAAADFNKVTIVIKKE